MTPCKSNFFCQILYEQKAEAIMFLTSDVC